MRNKYFKFLLNECKQLNVSSLSTDDLNKFIDSERGKQDFRAFCALQKRPEARRRLSTIFDNPQGELNGSNETESTKPDNYNNQT
jgi:hypothetical protein